jgi:hypothetical protein
MHRTVCWCQPMTDDANIKIEAETENSQAVAADLTVGYR